MSGNEWEGNGVEGSEVVSLPSESIGCNFILPLFFFAVQLTQVRSNRTSYEYGWASSLDMILPIQNPILNCTDYIILIY